MSTNPSFPWQSDSSSSVDCYSPSIYPRFYETLQNSFPGAMPLPEYLPRTCKALEIYGFTDENTMALVSTCRDEITEPLLHEVIKYWGKTFNCSSLAGFVMMGKTGLAAATGHVPIEAGVGRFVFYAMPHIAISKEGEVGIVYRDGLQKSSHACGALSAIVTELAEGHLNLQTDMQDLEQSILRQKLLSALRYGDHPDLVGITQLACQVISNDVNQLLTTLDPKVFNYVVMTGIQIHGPMDTHWIYPHDFYVVNGDRHAIQI